MHVLFAGNFPYPNGFAGTKRVQHYIDFLVAQGVRVEVLVLRGKPVLPGNEALEGVHRGVPYRVVGRDVQPGIRLPLAWFRFVRQGRRVLRAVQKPGEADILYFYGQPEAENLWLLRAARRLGYRIVFDLVEDYDLLADTYPSVFFNFKIRIKKCLARRIPSLADGLVVISRHLENKYASCGLPMTLVPITADATDGPSESSRHNPVRISYAGTFGTKDGIRTLLVAFQLARRSYPDCELVLAGGRQSPLEGLPAGLSKGVRYAGYLDDKAFYRFLQDADILCMTRTDTPYAHAGFPFKLGEYLAAGRPVVASRVSNLEDYLVDRRDARLVKPDDADALADALVDLLSHPDAAREMGLNGLRACREHFNPGRNGARLLELLRRLAPSKGGPL